MSKILITGGAGFIGSHLVEALIKAGHSVTVYDNLRTGCLSNIEHLGVKFIQGDILDENLLSKSMSGQELVFHLAAFTSVVESMKLMKECIDINFHGTLNVLKAAKENHIRKVIFASSAAVYGDSPELPKKEEMRLNPKSPYAITKVDGEYYCKFYSENYQLSTVCTRFFNVFGERQDPNSSYAAAIPIFISRFLQDQPVMIYGDGNQLRDFIYVKDLVKALMLLMDKGNGIFNIGYGKATDINTLVHMIQDYLKPNSKVIYTSERRGEIKNSYSSVDRLYSLGFKPDFSFETGLLKTIDYYKHNFNQR
jgi:UDP-glucose 4-epimerase